MEKTPVKYNTIKRIQVVFHFRWYTFMTRNNKVCWEGRKSTNQLYLPQWGILVPPQYSPIYDFRPCSYLSSKCIFSSVAIQLGYLFFLENTLHSFLFDFFNVCNWTFTCISITFPVIMKEFPNIPDSLWNHGKSLATYRTVILLNSLPCYRHISSRLLSGKGIVG